MTSRSPTSRSSIWYSLGVGFPVSHSFKDESPAFFDPDDSSAFYTSGALSLGFDSAVGDVGGDGRAAVADGSRATDQRSAVGISGVPRSDEMGCKGPPARPPGRPTTTAWAMTSAAIARPRLCESSTMS